MKNEPQSPAPFNQAVVRVCKECRSRMRKAIFFDSDEATTFYECRANKDHPHQEMKWPFNVHKISPNQAAACGFKVYQ